MHSLFSAPYKNGQFSTHACSSSCSKYNFPKNSHSSHVYEFKSFSPFIQFSIFMQTLFFNEYNKLSLLQLLQVFSSVPFTALTLSQLSVQSIL